MTQSPYVEQATLKVPRGTDARSIGAAVTVELCGHWEHKPPCTWPHHTEIISDNPTEVTVRILYCARPDEQQTIRQRIKDSLQTKWELVACEPGSLTEAELEHGAKISR